MTQARSVSLQPTSVAYWVYCLSVVWVAGRHDAGPQRESTADFCGLLGLLSVCGLGGRTA